MPCEITPAIKSIQPPDLKTGGRLKNQTLIKAG
jgi:hypothetical protein